MLLLEVLVRKGLWDDPAHEELREKAAVLVVVSYLQLRSHRISVFGFSLWYIIVYYSIL